MMPHPELIRLLAQQHRDDLIDDAERQRLLNAARRYRRVPRRRHR
jgi:hypothetical protein